MLGEEAPPFYGYQPSLLSLLHPLRKRILGPDLLLEKENPLLPEAGFFAGWGDLMRGKNAGFDEEGLLIKIQDADSVPLMDPTDRSLLESRMKQEILAALQQYLDQEGLDELYGLDSMAGVMAKEFHDVSCDVLQILDQKYPEIADSEELCRLLSQGGDRP